MISHLKGQIKSFETGGILISDGNVTYRILLPTAVLYSLQANHHAGDVIELSIYHYIQQDQSKGIPFLIGFSNDIEKEFFEHFITVSGIGPKAATRALKEPLSQIASAIDNADLSFLKKLPGIGERKAREIIVKLQGRIGKYGLIKDGRISAPENGHLPVKEEALAILIQLQYKKTEAEKMVEEALSRNRNVKSSEELLNEIYKRKAEV